MKKLLAILGVVSIAATSSATVVACQVQRNLNFDATEMGVFLGEVAKAVNLSDEFGYDFEYILEANVFSVNDEKREYFKKYFNNQLLSNNLKTDGYTQRRGKRPSDKDTILLMTQIVNSIGNLDSSKEKSPQLIQLINDILSTFGVELNSDSLNEVKDEISQFASIFESLGSSLSFNDYIGKTWTQAINSAIIEMVNGISRLVGDTRTINSANPTSENLTLAMNQLSVVVTKLSSGESSIDFTDILQNINVLPEFVNVIKLTVGYVVNFINSNTLTENNLTAARVKEFQNQTIDASANQIDLKEILLKLNDYILRGNDLEASTSIRNLLKILFINQSEEYYQSKTITNFINISNIFGSLEEIKIDASRVAYGPMIGAILNGVIDLSNSPAALILGNVELGNVISNILGMVASGVNILEPSVWEQISTLLSTALQLDAKVVKNIGLLLTGTDVVSLLWNENVIGDLLGVFTGETKDFSGKSIVSTPLSELFGIDGILGFDFITQGENRAETIQEIVDLMLRKIGEGNTIIDLDKISQIVKNLADLFSDLPDTVQGIVNGVDDETVNLIFSLTEDLRGLLPLSEFINTEVTKQRNSLIENVRVKFQNISRFSTTILDDNVFRYVMRGRTITLQLNLEDDFWKINSITLTSPLS